MIVGLLLSQAARARELRPADVRVLVVASDVLDYVQLRPLKAAGLALEVHMAPSQVAAALARLEAAGFLVRDPSTEPARYRLPFTRAPMGAIAPRIASDGRSGPRTH